MNQSIKVGTAIFLGSFVTMGMFYWFNRNAWKGLLSLRGSDEASSEYIQSLSKADLHCHLNGAVRPATLAELSGSESETVHNIEDAFRMFKKVYSVVKTKDVLRRIVREMLEDALADNLRYIEIRTTPRELEDVPSRREYVATVIDEINNFPAINTNRPLLDFPAGTIAVRLILTVDRSQDIEKAEETVRIAVGNSDMVVGIDFAGNPSVSSFDKFESVFRSAVEQGLYTTVHTSEIDGTERETDAILRFKPDRVGHFLFPSEEQVKKLIEAGIKIESCPSSNMCAITGQNPDHGQLDGHSTLDRFVRSDILSINTDDPGVFGKTLSDELSSVAKAHRLNRNEVKRLVKATGRHSFLTEPEQDALVASLGVQQRI